MVFINTIYAIIPSLLAIALAILTKRVKLSLLCAIILGALLIQAFNLPASVHYLFNLGINLFWDKGINLEHVYLLLYFFVLGTIITLLAAIGSVTAFSNWCAQFIQTRRRAKLFISFLGILVFIDDYFNSLAVGNIGQPIAKRYGISRSKLAYLIDSTAAPVCILSPVSSWGAYIIGIFSTLLAVHQVKDITAISMFVQLIPMHYYPLIAISLVFVVSYTNLNFGSMAIDEDMALKTQIAIAANESTVKPSSDKAFDMLIVMAVLLITTTLAFIWTGYQDLIRLGEPFSLISAFKYTDPPRSLLGGGLVSLLLLLLLCTYRKLPLAQTGKCFISGIMSMMPAVSILLMAWLMVNVISDLQLGSYLSGLVINIVNMQYLPFLMFILATFVGFSTGSSWVTFGIMLPIAAQMAITLNPEYMAMLFAAVLSGAVAGDHCSPISDTTVLSSIGAGCNHIDHVISQMPYGLLAFFIAACGFLILGITQAIMLSLIITFTLFFIVLSLFYKINKKVVLTANEA